MHTPYSTNSPEETFALGEKLALRLKLGDVILLFGDLGAGKTQLSKGIASGLGIKEAVKSPTFTYVNHYKIPDGELHHYDLYRLKEGDDFHSVGLGDSLYDPHAITVIEWADRLGKALPMPHIRIDMEASQGEQVSHEIRLTFVDNENFDEKKVEEYYAQWVTPMNVRAHNLQVAEVAKKIALAYAEAGLIVDCDHLYFAAILHDVARLCDFKNMDRKHFIEEITEEKWAKWEAQRKQYAGISHADIAHDFFISQGYPLIAGLIRSHTSATIVRNPEALKPLENRILYYADKRVKHDQIVPLKDRLQDGRDRNGRGNDEKTSALYEEAGKRAIDLERELFAPLAIKPEDIR